MMIELTDRGFAPLAIVLSFVAADGDESGDSCLLLKISPILTGRLTRRLAKCSGEIGLAGKLERKGDINQGPIFARQQRFGALKSLRADVLMGRLPDGRLECSREMEPAQARN
jgi:hypothetical protein